MYVSSSYTHSAYAVQASQKISPTQTTSMHLSSTQASNRLAEMQEKYKDIFTPIPETYTKESEELQAQKIHEAYPDYLTGRAFLDIVDSFYDGEPLERGKKITQEQIEKQEIAFQKAYDLFGGEEAYMEMTRGVQSIKNQHPINIWAKEGHADNAKELARFTNAAIYEGLEQGMNLDDATKQASSFRDMFMDTSYALESFQDAARKAGLTEFAGPEGEKKILTKEVDFNAPYNPVMDLRKYGIEGAWYEHDVIENQEGMLQEIVKKIGQFNFMLNNESLIEEAYMKLDGNYHDLANNAGYKGWINEKLMPGMQLGYKVFSNYQIYDSIDIKA